MTLELSPPYAIHLPTFSFKYMNKKDFEIKQILWNEGLDKQKLGNWYMDFQK